MQKRRLHALFARTVAVISVAAGIAAVSLSGAFATSAASHFSAAKAPTSVVSLLWHDL